MNLNVCLNLGLYLGISFGAIAIIIVIVILILVLKKKDKNKVKVNDEFMTSLISYLGDASNILSVSVDNARLKIEVKDIKKPEFEELKKLANQGVFVSGNFIKILFKYDSKLIKKELEKRI